jgi:hypothetical protein
MPPKRIGGGHCADEGDDLGVNRWAAHPAPPRDHGPVLPEPASLPTHDRIRSHEHERLSPPGPDPGEPNPEQAVRCAQPGPAHGSLVHGDLVIQGEVLEGELAVAAAEKGEDPKQAQKESDHRAWIVAGSQPTDQPFTGRPRFCRRTGWRSGFDPRTQRPRRRPRARGRRVPAGVALLVRHGGQ